MTAPNLPDEHSRCERHRGVFSPPSTCSDCRRLAAGALTDDERRAIRRAIDACKSCDDFARDDDLRDCEHHANFRHPRKETA